MVHTPLYEMMNNLCLISDYTWGMYAFSRELLRHRITEEEMRRMIASSIDCGTIYANRYINRAFRTSTITEELGLRINYGSGGAASDHILFALFTPPKQITIMKEPFDRVTALLMELEQEGLTLIKSDQLKDILIGHELFHYLELMNPNEIYTRTKKLKLWSLLFYTHYSTIRTLGEIAGMYFTKRLNHLSFSPFLLDLLLIYAYYPKQAESLYQDIMAWEHTQPASESVLRHTFP